MNKLNESVYENSIDVGHNAAKSRPNVSSVKKKSENPYEIAEEKCKYTL